MEFNLTLMIISTGRAWKEYYTDYDKCSKRIKKLRYSTRIKIIDIDCSCPDDTYALQHLYEYGY